MVLFSQNRRINICGNKTMNGFRIIAVLYLAYNTLR